MQQRSTNENQYTFCWPRNNEFLGIEHEERQEEITGKIGETLPIAKVYPVRRPPPYRSSAPDSPLGSFPSSPPDSPLRSMDEVD